jgi:hypothetical protein
VTVMAVYSYILKNQYACEDCAKQMGREKNDDECDMVMPEIRKCTLCGQKKETYHSRYYKYIARKCIEDAVVEKG